MWDGDPSAVMHRVHTDRRTATIGSCDRERRGANPKSKSPATLRTEAHIWISRSGTTTTSPSPRRRKCRKHRPESPCFQKHFNFSISKNESLISTAGTELGIHGDSAESRSLKPRSSDGEPEARRPVLASPPYRLGLGLDQVVHFRLLFRLERRRSREEAAVSRSWRPQLDRGLRLLQDHSRWIPRLQGIWLILILVYPNLRMDSRFLRCRSSFPFRVLAPRWLFLRNHASSMSCCGWRLCVEVPRYLIVFTFWLSENFHRMLILLHCIVCCV